MAVIKKKGLSPIVATVLLTALALVLAMIIFLWAKGFISEQIEKKGKSIDQICESVELEIDWKDLGDQKIQLSIVNRGSVPVNSLEIFLESGGSSSSYVVEIGLNTFGSITKEISVLDAERITIYPQLIGTIEGKKDLKEKTCLNNKKVIDL